MQRAEDCRLPGASKAERAAYAQPAGTDGFALLDAIERESTPPAARHAPMLATLRTVWQTHFERIEGGPPRWRDGAELPPVGERIQSKRGMLPAEHFTDSGYVDAELLVASRRDHGVSLEGPVRGLPTWASRAGHSYDLPHFLIDWKREQVTCPQGKVSVGWNRGRDETCSPRIHARFSRSDCGGCLARPLFAPAKEARRSVYFRVRDEYEALNAARARMQDPAWQRRYCVRAFGMRRSRYIGSVKTMLQKVCAAVGINAA